MAIEAGYDLGGIVGCYLLIGLLAVVGFTFVRLADILDVGIAGIHPFRGVANAIRSTIVSGCNAGVKTLEVQATRFENGLIDAFGLIIAIPLLLLVGLRAALQYLWNHALDPLIEAAVRPWRTEVSKASASIATIEREIRDTTIALPGKISGAVTGSLASAERFTVDHVTAAERDIRHDLGADISAVERKATAAVATAEGYADRQIRSLRDLEDSAIRSARDLAAAATAAALTKLEGELAGLRGDLAGQIAGARSALQSAVDEAAGLARTAEADALRAASDAVAAATAAAQTAIGEVRSALEGELGDLRALEDAAIERARAASSAALDKLRGIATEAENELTTIEGTLGVQGLAAAVAAIPALAVLVHAIADEAGLGRPECRGKVKNICSVDPSAWAGLLSGVGLLGMTLDFRSMVDTGRELLHILEEGGEAIGLGT